MRGRVLRQHLLMELKDSGSFHEQLPMPPAIFFEVTEVRTAEWLEAEQHSSGRLVDDVEIGTWLEGLSVGSDATVSWEVLSNPNSWCELDDCGSDTSGGEGDTL